jgi:hypothetical protein
MNNMGMDMYMEARNSARRESPYLRKALEAVHRSVRRAIKSQDPLEDLRKLDGFLAELKDAFEHKYGPSPDFGKLNKLLGMNKKRKGK